MARVLAGNFQITDNSVLVNLCCDQFERRRITRDSQLHHFVYNTVLHLNARVQEIYTERIFLTFLIRSLDRNPDRPHGFRNRATAQLKSDSSVLGTSQKSAQFLLIFDDPPVLRAQLAGYLRKPVRGRLQSFPIGATFLLQRSDSLFKRCEPLYRSWIGERRLSGNRLGVVTESRRNLNLCLRSTRCTDLAWDNRFRCFHIRWSLCQFRFPTGFQRSQPLFNTGQLLLDLCKTLTVCAGGGVRSTEMLLH